MTPDQAMALLGLSPGADQEELKKRYRRLMHRIHPDAGIRLGEEMLSDEERLHRTQQLNLAYAMLKREIPERTRREAGSSAKEASFWSAPVNPYAYCQREILHYAEDAQGQTLGSFSIARGKYLWQTEEDFPLFLLSIYRCGSRLLDEIEADLGAAPPAEIRKEIQPELTYLLAQQFLDCISLLEELGEIEKDPRGEDPVYSIRGMLEANKGWGREGSGLKEGELLIPSALRNHRLYLKNLQGRELGYLSFWDDRLYYIVVPLFEQRRVQVRIQAAGSGAPGGRRGKYYNLKLWIRFKKQSHRGLPESLNLQIEDLLEDYRKACKEKRKGKFHHV